LASLVTSLADLTGRPISRCELLVDILQRVDGRLAELGREPQQIGRRANELCLQHGSHLTVRSGTRETSGICAGIAPDGALLLDTLTGRQSLYSGVLVKER
jgi:biotin-(acetyl-CoA carboxylase) ligase